LEHTGRHLSHLYDLACLKQVSKLAYADIFMLITKKTFEMPY
jgi:hypothetical protein